MKLFVNCQTCNFQIFINHPGKIRQEIPQSFEIICSNCGARHVYDPWKVIAESGLTTATGALLGGLLGLTLGGVGALAGAILGGIVGRNSQEQDEINVARFNNS